MRNLYYLILSWFAFPCLWFYRNRVRVLAYHTVNDKVNFEKQLKYISRHFNVISAKDFKQYLAGNIGFPKNTVLITFDDGDRSVLENGLPLLTKYKLPAVLFIITDLIDTCKPFWWYEIEKLVDKSKVWEVKNISNANRLAYLDKIRRSNDKQVFQNQLTTQELKLMHSNNITISNHSHTQSMFDKSTKEELELEMNKSKSFLTHNEFDHELFAYPNGNYEIIAEEVLKKNSIKFAFLFDHLINEKSINPLRISRIRVNREDDLNEFVTKVTGQHSLLYQLK